MKFVTADQRSPEWYRWRLGRVTASEAKSVVAFSKRGIYAKDDNGEFMLDDNGKRILEYPELEARKKYRQRLVTERIYGMAGVEEVYVNDAMRWGMLNEDIARTQYKLFTGNKVTEEGFCIMEIDGQEIMAGCSTDGLVNDDGNLEIKNLTPSNHLYEIIKQNELPEQFEEQVDFQLLVTGREYAHFVGYDSRAPMGIDILAVQVDRTKERELHIAYLREELFKFLAEVDRDYNFFLRYLPYAERICKDCGTVFEAYTNICTGCYGNNIRIGKIIKKAETNLLNNIAKRKVAL